MGSKYHNLGLTVEQPFRLFTGKRHNLNRDPSLNSTIPHPFLIFPRRHGVNICLLAGKSWRNVVFKCFTKCNFTAQMSPQLVTDLRTGVNWIMSVKLSSVFKIIMHRQWAKFGLVED